ncbi:hypothetical protein T4E_9042 [Trichinella pseudospiralis]|uniref:C2H2-type domain-containing protein n=1 Tax=Trichinella pseudospiralis TaxID=6337 RepID=A0A0V0XMW0_TRIPS|nr:hypothetical protein T4E_9042 [Trichinella pseudospiralis]
MATDTARAFNSATEGNEAEQNGHPEERHGRNETRQNDRITIWLCMGCGVRVEWSEIERHFFKMHMKLDKLNMLCPVHYCSLVDVKSLRLHHSCFREEALRDEAFCCRVCKFKARRLGELVGHMLYMHKCYQCGCCGASLSGGIAGLKMHQDSCHNDFNTVLFMYKTLMDDFLNEPSRSAHSRFSPRDKGERVIIDLTMDDDDYSSKNSTAVNQSGVMAVGSAPAARLPNVDAVVTTVASSSSIGSWNNRAWPSDRAAIASFEHYDTPRSPVDEPVDVTVDCAEICSCGVERSNGRFRAHQNVPLKKITVYKCTICLKEYDTKKAAYTHLETVHLRRKVLSDLIEAQDRYVARSSQHSDRRGCDLIENGNVPSTSACCICHDT